MRLRPQNASVTWYASPSDGGRSSLTLQPACESALAAALTVAEIVEVGLAIPSSAYQATRSPSSLGAVQARTGTTPESIPSGPASTFMAMRRSATYRAMGPTCPRVSVTPPARPYAPVTGISPAVGFRAATPQ